MNIYIILGTGLIILSLILFILYMILGKHAGEKLRKELKEEY